MVAVRGHITSHLRDELSLPIVRTELLQIKTFGGADCDHTSCDVVQMGVETKYDVAEMMHALVVPFICDPLAEQPNRPLQQVSRSPHWSGIGRLC